MLTKEKGEKESSQMAPKNSLSKKASSDIEKDISAGILSLGKKWSGKATKSFGR